MAIPCSAAGSNCESREGNQRSPHLFQMLIVVHGGSAPIFVVASVSFSSAHVSVAPTVVVRVMLD